VDIIPKIPDAKFATDGHSRPVGKNARPAQSQGVGMKKGQGNIDGIFRLYPPVVPDVKT
jgi:hypothetical protein